MTTAKQINIENQSLNEFEAVELYLQIRKRSIFGRLSQKKCRELLANHLDLIDVKKGAEVPQGKPTQYIWMVVEGQIKQESEDGHESRYRQNIAGRTIEMDTFLNQSEKWSTRWFAACDSRLFRIDAQAFIELLKTSEHLYEYLTRISNNTEFIRFANDLRVCGYTSTQVERVIGSFKYISSAEAIEEKMEQGAIAIVAKGDAIVYGKINRKKKLINHYMTFEYFYIQSRENEYAIESSPNSTFWVIHPAQLVDIVGKDQANSFISFIDRISTLYAAMKENREKNKVTRITPTIREEITDDGPSIEDFQISDEELAHLYKQPTPVVKQHDEMDCGAAVLATVSKFYKKKIGIPTFRSLVHVTKDGASLASVKQGAEAVGFRTCGIFVKSSKGLRNLRVPFIALLQYHFVVVYKVDDDNIKVGDPALGLVDMARTEFMREYSGNILALEPTEKFLAQKESSLGLGKYLHIFRGNRHQLFLIGLIGILSFALGLAGPIFQQLIFDSVLMDGNFELINGMAIALLTVSMVTMVNGWIHSYLSTHMTTAVDSKLGALFFRHAYSLPLHYFSVRRVGDFTTRISELRSIRNFITQKPSGLFFKLISVLIYSTVVGLYSIECLLVIFAFLPLIIGFIKYTTPKLTQLKRRSLKQQGRNSSALIEQIRGLATIKSTKAELAARWRWSKSFMKQLEIRKESAYLGAIFSAVSTSIQQSMKQVLFFVAIFQFIDGNLSLGQVVAISALASQIVAPIVSLLNEYSSFHNFGVSLSRVDDIFTAQAEPLYEGYSLNRDSFKKFRGDIEFRDVTFQYGSDMSPIVLDNINLNIPAGSTVAFVGRSGSGKTTLAYMVNRLYAQVSGSILIDGVDSKEYPVRQLRRNVAMIMQENSLFSGSILENISLGDPHPDFRRVMQAAVSADAHDFISELPEGYSTRLSESGAGLSGGQMQRINIARALYLDPSILIMDEATSALDAISEETIVRNLRDNKESQRTTLIIAHRLNTIMHADKIVVLAEGRIIEQGSHTELMQTRGTYYNLFRKQMIS